MSRAWFVLCLLMSTVALTAQGPGAPKPGPEHKRLEFFVGKWQFEGEIKKTDFGPAGKMTGTEQCEWFEGGFHVICRGEGSIGGQRSKELVVLGYDRESGVFTRYNIGSSGEGGFATAKIDGKVWRWQGVHPAAQNGMRFRFPWTETSADTYTGTVEISKDGKTYQTVIEAKATRVK